MRLIEKAKNNDGVRYGFDVDGLFFAWCDINKSGEWVDGTFKNGSIPQKKQMKLIKRHLSN